MMMMNGFKTLPQNDSEPEDEIELTGEEEKLSSMRKFLTQVSKDGFLLTDCESS